jgi:hypothetical protein
MEAMLRIGYINLEANMKQVQKHVVVVSSQARNTTENYKATKFN